MAFKRRIPGIIWDKSLKDPISIFINKGKSAPPLYKMNDDAL